MWYIWNVVFSILYPLFRGKDSIQDVFCAWLRLHWWKLSLLSSGYMKNKSSEINLNLNYYAIDRYNLLIRWRQPGGPTLYERVKPQQIYNCIDISHILIRFSDYISERLTSKGLLEGVFGILAGWDLQKLSEWVLHTSIGFSYWTRLSRGLPSIIFKLIFYYTSFHLI
jgi:hypothetical protein